MRLPINIEKLLGGRAGVWRHLYHSVCPHDLRVASSDSQLSLQDLSQELADSGRGMEV
jgi:hypothetical protein